MTARIDMNLAPTAAHLDTKGPTDCYRVEYSALVQTGYNRDRSGEDQQGVHSVA